MIKNPHVFSVKGNEFTIKFYIMSGYSPNCILELSKKAENRLIEILGCIGATKLLYVCSDKKGLNFEFIYTCPSAYNCKQIITDRLIKGGFKQIKLREK